MSNNSFSPGSERTAAVKVVVATTVMLSFISFWRAAANVLSDLASSAYYVGGIAEQDWPPGGNKANGSKQRSSIFSWASPVIPTERQERATLSPKSRD